MLIRAGARPRPLGLRPLDGPGEVARRLVSRPARGRGERRVDDFLPGPHRVLGARAVDGLAGEARGVHLRLGGDDDGVGRGDLLRRELVLRPDRPLRLDLDGVPERPRGFLQGFGGHERVRDAGRAGGDADETFPGGGLLRFGGDGRGSGDGRNRSGRGLARRDETERRFEHLSRVADGLADWRLIDRQPFEARSVHAHVGRQHGHVRRGDILVGQHVPRPDRPLRLDLDVVTHHLGGLLQRFGGQKGVGDAGRAGCHRNDFHIRRGLFSSLNTRPSYLNTAKL